MILDTAKIALTDGTTKAAIDLNPGGTVLSVFNYRVGAAPIVNKTVENHRDIVSLILSNGERLVGSRDQRVAIVKNKRVRFVEMTDVDPGVEVAGSVAGAHVVTRIIGIMYHANKEVRLVGLEMPKNGCFVAEGVMCR
jgi:hypothetical protein